MVKVSVVVPVYNAGEYIDLGARSLFGQTIGQAAYEVIYVNDGSTDDSAERLRRLAAQHANVRVHDQENSGWPGKPRNVGIEMARGEYIQFLDQDDELALDALERLYEYAKRHGADIAFGKTYGRMQGPIRLFRHNREKCSAADADLFATLTPHKMFRRQFLLDHDIRFPEGRVRLEDQLFLAQAYPLAKTVSVLGEHPTYHWRRREDGGNNSRQPPRPEDYYHHLRNVIRAVKDRSTPGPVQDRMLQRSYRGEIMRPVTEPRIFRRTGADLQRYFDVVHQLVTDEMPTSVGAGLPGLVSLRAHLLEAGRLDALLELARRTSAVQPCVRMGEPGWRGGRLHLPLEVSYVRGDGAPLAVVSQDGRWFLDPDLLAGVPGVDRWEIRDPRDGSIGSLIVRDRPRMTWWFAQGDLEPHLTPVDGHRHQVVLSGTLVLDPATIAERGPLGQGLHLPWLEMSILGLRRRERLSLRLLADAESRQRAESIARRLAFGADHQELVASWRGDGRTLRLRVTPPAGGRAHRWAAWAAADDRRWAWARAARRRTPDRALRLARRLARRG